MLLRMPAWSTRARWLTALSASAVLGANAAGLWGIAVARRGAQEEAGRTFRLETAARARIVESALHATRADLVFLAGSSAVSRLKGFGRGASDAEWHQLAAEAVLVFLRAHPEIAHLTVRSGRGYALVRTGRRGGLPVLWSASDEQAAAGGGPHAERRSDERYLRVEVTFEGGGPDAVTLDAEIDAEMLLERSLSAPSDAQPCVLRDGSGRTLAVWPAGAAPSETHTSAEASLPADGWSAPSPWTMRCSSPAALDVPAAVERRYRLTLALNAGAMVLALLLGSFAIRQTRRRDRLEAQAREDLKVRELERQLFHAERLGTVGRLAAGMAHEINNPLEGMANYLSLARDDLARGDAEKAARRLDGLRQGMDRIAGIVRQVLVQADPAAPAEGASADLSALVRETLDFIRTRREFHSIAFTADAPGDECRVPGNAVTLGQVLLNLVLNACEAQPSGGEVHVALRRNGTAVILEVADRGPGIAPADLPRVFDPFFSTKQSTGLGLSICHAIVRQHRGELIAENRAGGGALFRLRLPSA